MRSDIVKGDVVDVIRRNVTITSVSSSGISAEMSGGGYVHWPDNGEVEFINIRRYPEHWPPQPGDVWTDGEGDEFYIYQDSGNGVLLGRSQGPRRDIEAMYDDGARLRKGRLVHRKGDQRRA